MSVIKASSMAATIHDIAPVSFNLNDVKNAAQDQLNQIKLKAAEIIQQAHEEAKKIKAQAEVAGQQDAFRKLQQNMKSEVDRQAASVMPALQNVVNQINLAKQHWEQKWEHSAIHVATAIAEKIIQKEIAHQPQIAMDLIKQTLQLASNSGEMKVHLNPGDLSVMQQSRQLLEAELKKLAPTEIIANENIAPGGCFVETKFGTIDNTIETQLNRIESELEA